MARQAMCLIVCSTFLAACGSSPQRSGQSGGTNTSRIVSTQSSTCSPRGTSLVSVSVAPAKPLSKTAVNVIEPRMGLAYAVTVLNSGCRRETQIGVRLEIASPGQPVIGHAQIDHIDPGEEKTVLIGHLGLPVLDKKLVLHVEVEPVPTEVSLDNNSAEYSVRYVLS